MPQVTDLKLQKNKRIVNLFIDNQFASSLNLETIVKKGIKVGTSLSKVELEKIINKSAYEKLLSYALNFLSYRPRSEQEVKKYLTLKIKQGKVVCPNEKTTGKVLEKLKRKKILNDDEFVNWWINQRTKYKPKGNYLLKKELYAKGINKELIEQNICNRDEFEAIRNLYEKKAKKYKNISSNKIKQKLIQMFQRNGFSWSTIKQVVDEYSTKK